MNAPLLALTRAELRMGLRAAAFRLAVAGTFLLGWAAGGAPGRGVSSSAYGTAEAAWQYLGFVTVIWMSLAAVRDTVLRTDILVYSKPQPTERLVLAKFLGAFLQLLLIDFDPLSPDQNQSLLRGKNSLQLLLGQGFLSQGHFHSKI